MEKCCSSKRPGPPWLKTRQPTGDGAVVGDLSSLFGICDRGEPSGGSSAVAGGGDIYGVKNLLVAGKGEWDDNKIAIINHSPIPYG